MEGEVAMLKTTLSNDVAMKGALWWTLMLVSPTSRMSLF